MYAVYIEDVSMCFAFSQKWSVIELNLVRREGTSLRREYKGKADLLSGVASEVAIVVHRLIAVDLALLLAVTARRFVEEVVGSVSWVCGSAVVRRV